MKGFWQQHKLFLLIISGLICFFFLSIVLHQWSTYCSIADPPNGFGDFISSRWHFDFFANNTGGIFTILIGLVTVFGIYLAIIQIREQKSIITTYSQLMDNLTALLNDKNSKEIKIVSHFILPGFWQVADDTKRKNFYDAVKTHTNKIKITCINREEHLSTLIDMAKKGIPPAFKKAITKNDIIDFQEKCEGLLAQINMNDKKRLSHSKIPHYFFFVSNKRAIIITPVGLPIPNNETLNDIKSIGYSSIIDNKDDNEYIDKSLSKSIPVKSEETKVHTLGFATADQNIIDMLWELYDKISESKE